MKRRKCATAGEIATGTEFKALTEPAGFINEFELLKRIPISRRTAYAWERAGKLPVVKIGRRKLFHWPSVEAALLRQQRGA